MSEIKVLKKGEFLFKENDKAQFIYFVQSGRLVLGWLKDGKFIEYSPVASPGVVGESLLIGGSTYNLSCMATTEAKVLPLAVDALKIQMESLPQAFKIITKSILDRQKIIQGELKNLKFEQSQTACPEDKIPKLFASLYFTAQLKGTQDTKDPLNKVMLLNWNQHRLYIHKVFDEPMKRLEGALLILKKLKLADLIYGPPPENPEGVEILLEVRFVEFDFLGWFVDYFQHFYFKPERATVLKFDETSYRIVQAAIELAENSKMRYKSLVRIGFEDFNQVLKDRYNLVFSPDQQVRLEGKGVFFKRVVEPQGSYFELDLSEVRNYFKAWSLLREIEKWNIKGFVDPQDNEESKASEALPNKCPSCSGPIDRTHKFCPHCGFRLVAG